VAASAPAARSTPGRLDGWTLGPSFAAAVADVPLSVTNASPVSTTRRHARDDFRCPELAGAAGKPGARVVIAGGPRTPPRIDAAIVDALPAASPKGARHVRELVVDAER